MNDSRGRLVPLYPVSPRWVRNPNAEPYRRSVPLVVVIGAVVLAILAAMLLLGTFAMVLGIVGLSVGAEMYSISPQRTIHTMLHRGFCASCAYPIRTIAPESDGCVVCPECGAAWRFQAGGPPQEFR